MKCVRAILVSEVKLCFRPLSWLKWMKLFEINWNCSLSPITFLISFLIVLRKTIDLKALGELYDSLLSLGMMIDVETLKYKGQWPDLKHISAILIIFFKHLLSLMIHLRCFHINLLGPGDDESLHLIMELVNSALENGTQLIGNLSGILSNTLMSIWWSWAILKDE